MNILILHRVPYDFIKYHEVLNHQTHQAWYVGLKDNLSNIPLDLLCNRLERSGDSDLVDGVTAIIKDFTFKFDRIICMSQYEQEFAAELRDRFDIPGERPEELKLLNDKIAMKKRVMSRGLLTPRFLSCEDIKRDMITPWPGKTVLKPVDGTASKDVLVFDHFASAAKAILEGTTGIEKFALGRFECEEFIEGTIYHFDGVVLAGNTITMVASRYLNTCLDYASGTPLGSVQLDDDCGRCAEAKAFVDAVGLESGVFHLEMIESHEGLCFLEIAGRVGGADVATVMEAATGINLIKISLALALDNRPLQQNDYQSLFQIKRSPSVFGWFVFPGHLLAGESVDITNSDEFRKHPHMLHWREVRNPRKFAPTMSYNDYEVPLSGVVAGKNTELLESFLACLLHQVQITTSAEKRRSNHLLLVGCHDVDLDVLAVLDIEITLFQKPDRLTSHQKKLCARCYAFDYEDSNEAIKIATELHSIHPIQAVASFTEYGLETAAIVKEALQVSGNPLAPVSATRDKLIMRKKNGGRRVSYTSI